MGVAIVLERLKVIVLEIAVAAVLAVVSAILFVLSSGHLFKDRFKDNRVLIAAIAAIAAVSTISLLYDPMMRMGRHWFGSETAPESKTGEPSGRDVAARKAGEPDAARRATPVRAGGEPAAEAARRQAALDLLAPGIPSFPDSVSLAEAREQVRANPKDPDLWWQLGHTLREQGYMKEAAQAHEEATRLPPDEVGRAFLYRDLAQVLENAGEAERALAAAETSVRSWPLTERGLFCRGEEVMLLTRLLVKTRGRQAAASFYRPLYQKQPAHEECRAIYRALAA